MSPGALAAGANEDGERAEVVAVVPADSDERLARASEALSTELEEELTGFTVSLSRLATDAADLYRAGQEARLAANVGEAEGRGCWRSTTPGRIACCSPR